MNQPKVSILLLNWNRADDTIACLRSLFKIHYRDFETVLVDNGSKDDSVAKILIWARQNKVRIIRCPGQSKRLAAMKQKFDATRGAKLFLIENAENYGFAGGNNIGLELLVENNPSKYILLLNTDTTVKANFLTKLVATMEADKRLGSAQAVLLNPDKKTVDSLGQQVTDGKIFDVDHGKIFKSPTRITKEIFGACAAGAIYRSDILAQIGIFDPHFETALEDVDLSFRIRLAGYKSVLCLDSFVYHKGGVSRGDKKAFQSLQSYIGSRNTLMVFLRYLRFKPKYLRAYLYHFAIAFICAVKFRRLGDLSENLSLSRKLRQFNKKNPLLKEIQAQWQR